MAASQNSTKARLTMNRAKARKGPMIRLRSKNINSDIANWPLPTTVMWLCIVNSRELRTFTLSSEDRVMQEQATSAVRVLALTRVCADIHARALNAHKDTEKQSRIFGVPVKPGLRSTRTRARALDIKYRTIETTIIGNHSLIKILLTQKD
jgi:hypothetical protein